MTDQPQQPGEMSPEDQARALHTQAAYADEERAELDAALEHHRRRSVALNVEVRMRDARIAELEQECAGYRSLLHAAAHEPGDEPEPDDPESKG